MLSNRLKAIFEGYNGTLSTKMATAHDIDKETLRKAVLRKDIEKFTRGIYVLPDAIPDEYLAIQEIYSKGIFSHEGALLLHNYTTFTPFKYYMTFPQGYHSSKFKERMVEPTFVKKKFHELGVTEAETWMGNKVRVYDRERTILDMCAASPAGTFIMREMWMNYREDEHKDLDRLREYAKKMDRESLIEGVVFSNVE